MFAWLTGKGDTPPVFLKVRSAKWFILLTVSCAVFTDIFLYGIVVPVLPFALTSRANIDPSKIQSWVAVLLAVYGAALLVAAPVCGWLADKSKSRRAPLVFGLFALAGSTVLLCVGRGIGMLIAGRVLQGLSAAVVWTVGLALLVDTVEQNEVGQAMGYVGLSMSLAVLAAPLLGGVVFNSSGYYAVFAMAFGMIVLDLLLRVAMIEKKIAVQWLPDEDSGDANAATNVTRPDNSAPEGGGAIASVLPDEQAKEANTDEKHASDDRPEAIQPAAHKWASRLPPVIWLLGSRRLLSALWACLIQASLLTAFDSILPLFVRDTFGWDSTGAGLIFLPVVVPTFVGPVVGWLCDKHGPRWYATAGFVVACPCIILLRLVHENTLQQKVLLCALLALIGLTLTIVLTPMMAEITYAVDTKAKHRPPGFFGEGGAYAQAYGLFNMAFAGGCMVGPLLAGMINQSLGWGTATLILGCVSIATALPTVIWSGGSIWKQRQRDRDGRAVAEGSLAAV